MRPEELRALGDLAGDAAAGIAAQAREVHAEHRRAGLRRAGPDGRAGAGDPRPGRRRRLRRGVRVHRRAGPRRRGRGQPDARPDDAPSLTDGTARRAWPSARSTACGATACTATAARWRRRWRCASAGATWRSTPARCVPPSRRPRRGWRCSSTACARPRTPGGCAPRGSVPYGGAAAHRAGLHADLRPLQQRPAHLRQRAGAGGAARRADRALAGRGRRDRAHRPLDGRPRRTRRLPLRRGGLVA